MAHRIVASTLAEQVAAAVVNIGMVPEQGWTVANVVDAANPDAPNGLILETADLIAEPSCLTDVMQYLAASSLIVIVFGTYDDGVAVDQALRERTGLTVMSVIATDLIEARCTCGCGSSEPVDLESNRIIAEAVAAGMEIPRPRHDIDQALTPGRFDQPVTLECALSIVEAVADRRAWADEAIATVAGVLNDEAAVGDRDVVDHLVAASLLIPVRDLYMFQVTVTNARAAWHLFTDLAGHAEGEAARNLLGLAAFAAWMDGNGHAARLACDAADNAGDEAHTLADLVRMAARLGMNPAHWTPPASDVLERALETL
ncbi:DUF4192 domain-containing protein [Mumia sp. zg.B21]|uniref:DUF4192 family protein n=1 Tax=Mumia sp. zg.B21 TaxID=2855447 RepID=UPI001C6EB42C|nr:DUF4192 family protein [Mumia sp. zg.B21]MBW9211774.1 DUF4192 domain-containing protein [Mumia sp. zg.B21]